MTASYRPLFAVVCVLCVVSADAIMQAEEKGRKMSPPGLDCEKARFNMDCLKLDLVSFLETMSDTKEYRIGGGLSIVQDASVNRTKNADIVAGKTRRDSCHFELCISQTNYKDVSCIVYRFT